MKALTSHSPDGLDDATRLAAPGSWAALLVDYQRQRDQLRVEAGEHAGPDDVRRQDQLVTVSCPRVEACWAFTDWVFEGTLISSFSIGSVPIDGHVAGPAGPVMFAGDTYQIAGAMVDPTSGALGILVRVTGGSPGSILPLDATLNGSRGQVVPSDFRGSLPRTTTQPGTTTLALYEFLQPGTPQSVTLHVCTQRAASCQNVVLPFVQTA